MQSEKLVRIGYPLEYETTRIITCSPDRTAEVFKTRFWPHGFDVQRFFPYRLEIARNPRVVIAKKRRPLLFFIRKKKRLDVRNNRK